MRRTCHAPSHQWRSSIWMMLSRISLRKSPKWSLLAMALWHHFVLLGRILPCSCITLSSALFMSPQTEFGNWWSILCSMRLRYVELLVFPSDIVMLSGICCMPWRVLGFWSGFLCASSLLEMPELELVIWVNPCWRPSCGLCRCTHKHVTEVRQLIPSCTH